MQLDGKTVLVTGGTGSFGRLFVRTLLERHDVAAVRVLSRDELKQSELQREIEDPRLRLLLGDVRDLDRLRLATRGVDLIVHAAALKQVPALEYNPLEAIHTNITGVQNVATAAIENRVSLVIGLSTDKAVAPTNLYGASKLCGERLLAQAGVYSSETRFAAVRYGNVVGSRGSVVPIFQEQAKTGVITITDERMTRFWITLPETVEFVFSCLPLAQDGETFIPKIPTANILDIAEALAPGAEHLFTGIRPGEKLHEVLLTVDEAREALDIGDRYLIPPFRPTPLERAGERLPDGFYYGSDSPERRLTIYQLRELLGVPDPVHLEYPY